MWWLRLRNILDRSVFRRARGDQDLDDELRFHLAEETRLLLERGASPQDAARAAGRALGSTALVKEATRAVWVSTRFEQLWQDLRFGSRILTRSPALSATAVVLMTLVVGGNTTIFSIAHGILHKSAPGVHGIGLITLNWAVDDGHAEASTSYVNYADLAEQSATLRPMAALQPYGRFALRHEGGSHAISISRVSGNYFRTLGVRFARGRSFTEEETSGGASALPVVLSHRTWRDLFNSDDAAMGASVLLNGLSATIVGVASEGFQGAVLLEAADAWVPLVAFAEPAETVVCCSTATITRRSSSVAWLPARLWRTPAPSRPRSGVVCRPRIRFSHRNG